MAKHYMAISHDGITEHNLGQFPRAELLRRYNRQHADPVYQDKKDGSTIRVGYIIAKHWFALFEVIPVEHIVRFDTDTDAIDTDTEDRLAQIREEMLETAKD